LLLHLAAKLRLQSDIDCGCTVQEDNALNQQSALCAYLSLIALVGLAINAIWHVKWADPIAALAVLPLIVWEGQEAMHGNACGCC